MNPPTNSGQHLAEALHAEISAERIARVISDGLSATTTTRSGAVEPDTRSRLAALQLLLAYTEGKPIERQQIVVSNVSADPVSDIEERLARSPALRRSLTATLAKMDG